MITRREIIQGLGGFVAAPAVIRVADLMLVKTVQTGWILDPNMDAIIDIETGYRMTRLQFEQRLYGNNTAPIDIGFGWESLRLVE